LTLRGVGDSGCWIWMVVEAALSSLGVCVCVRGRSKGEMRSGEPGAGSPHCLWLLAAAALLTARYCCCGATAGGGQGDKVIWAINAGGEAHTDIHGIHFKRDPLEGKMGRGKPRGEESNTSFCFNC